MRRPSAGTDFIQLPTASTFSLCDGLLRMAHRLMIELPEPELREVRYTLDTLLARVEQLLDSAEVDLSLNFEGLSFDQGESWRFHLRVSAPVSSISDRNESCIPGVEDFGAVFVSTSVSTTTSDSSGLTLGSSPTRRRNTTSRVPVPATATFPTPTPTPVPARVPTPVVVSDRGPFPLILSSRNNVGFPDYTHHPHFVRPGSQSIPFEQQDLNLLRQESQVLTSTPQHRQSSPIIMGITSLARVCT